MNYKEINSYVSTLLGESSSTFFTDDERRLVINQACSEIASSLDFLRTSQDYTTTANVGNYRLPSDFYNWGEGVDLFDGSTTTSLIAVSVQHLRQINADWEDQTGTPTHYASENSMLYLYPTPDRDYSVRVNYQPGPNPIGASDTDIPFYGNLRAVPYHDLIAYKAAWLLLLKDREFDTADRVMQMYQRRFVDFREALRETGDTRYAVWSDSYRSSS